MTPDRPDIVVIGAGVVGLGTALDLTRRRPRARIAVVEAEPHVAAHQSGHNSGVIHAGLYYPPGSRKATLCNEGREAMYRFCAERGVPVRNCGKLVVASDQDDAARLRDILDRGCANGLDGLTWLDDADAIRGHEPNVDAVAAIHVPQTGVVDFAAVARAMADALAETGRVTVTTGAAVRALHPRAREVTVETTRGEIRTSFVVACAGLQADRLAIAGGLDPGAVIVPFRGEYMELQPAARPLVRNLIYPTPDPRYPFLGVHFTRMIDDRVEVGPNAVLALSRTGYRRDDIDWRDVRTTLGDRGFRRFAAHHWRTGVTEMVRSLSREQMWRAMRRMVPTVKRCDVVPGRAGVRAMAIGRDGRMVDDFQIVAADRQVHVISAPSPAATASLALGRWIAGEVAARLGD